jgi:hypothetical protein
MKTIAELTDEGYFIRHSNFGKNVIILDDHEIYAIPKSDYGQPVPDSRIPDIPAFLLVEET